MRFVMIGMALVFAGFVTLGIAGADYRAASIESDEFETCYEYPKDGEPVETDCSARVAGQALFFALIIGVIGAGVVSLIKGARGDWDGRVRPEDVVGPGKKGG
ncbi:MAG: hypothetical protein EB829_01095 [Nitrosopumilus sp. H8]|nr:MAG: hypothetical protein EB830_02270 [Nitrosopumilus sp. H13]RNJ79947.1 MAG: hypothetical protein EB829_01095 [Nitrosopumilus sp. H8]